MKSARIAIISTNTLEAVGLESVINELLPMCEVSVFATLDDLLHSSLDSSESQPSFFHYFVEAQQVVEHSDFFLSRIHQTIVLAPSNMRSALFEHFHRLNPNLPEKQLIKAVLSLNQIGHGDTASHHSPDHTMGHIGTQATSTLPLSNREAEVLALVVKGFINKEIADKLYISLNTVITHRKNICEKLHLHSVSSLTIYAITHGIVRMDEI